MAGGAAAVSSGAELEQAVSDLAELRGLRVRRQVALGVGGSAEEKIPATIQDIAAWPIPGLVVFAGNGFSTNMTSYLHSTGKAVAFDDLEGWLALFLGLPESKTN